MVADASAAITLTVGDGRGINGRLAIAMMGRSARARASKPTRLKTKVSGYRQF